MKQIPVAELVPGMVTAEDILAYNNKVIVPKGIILTENIISRLDAYSIYYANIEDNIDEELSTPMADQTLFVADASIVDLQSPSYQSNKEKMKESQQFLRFSEEFDRCAAHFQDSLTNSLYRNEPFHANEILKEVLALLYQDGTEVSIFDMLLNMHRISLLPLRGSMVMSWALLQTATVRHWMQKPQEKQRALSV